MPRHPSTNPTDGELEILQVLWDRGQSTVREVYEQISRTRPTGYTTTLKLMQIMLDKGLLKRDESSRAQVYRPAVTREEAQRQLVGDLLDRAFDGSAARLVTQLLSAKKVSPDEIAEIRRLIRKQLDSTRHKHGEGAK